MVEEEKAGGKGAFEWFYCVVIDRECLQQVKKKKRENLENEEWTEAKLGVFAEEWKEVGAGIERALSLIRISVNDLTELSLNLFRGRETRREGERDWSKLGQVLKDHCSPFYCTSPVDSKLLSHCHSPHLTHFLFLSTPHSHRGPQGQQHYCRYSIFTVRSGIIGLIRAEDHWSVPDPRSLVWLSRHGLFANVSISINPSERCSSLLWSVSPLFICKIALTVSLTFQNLLPLRAYPHSSRQRSLFLHVTSAWGRQKVSLKERGSFPPAWVKWWVLTAEKRGAGGPWKGGPHTQVFVCVCVSEGYSRSCVEQRFR